MQSPTGSSKWHFCVWLPRWMVTKATWHGWAVLCLWFVRFSLTNRFFLILNDFLQYNVGLFPGLIFSYSNKLKLYAYFCSYKETKGNRKIQAHFFQHLIRYSCAHCTNQCQKACEGSWRGVLRNHHWAEGVVQHIQQQKLTPRPPELRGLEKQVKGAREEQFPGSYRSAFETLLFTLLVTQVLQPQYCWIDAPCTTDVAFVEPSAAPAQRNIQDKGTIGKVALLTGSPLGPVFQIW